MFLKHFNKEKLHHAYLIEGRKEEILPLVLNFIESLGISTLGNPDFYHISIDSFKIDDARLVKSLEENKSFNIENKIKKIYIITTNNFLLEAQNSLLKIFEEPIQNTHFFLIMPNTDGLLETFFSRFYFISTKSNSNFYKDKALEFISMSLQDRIFFIKEFLTEEKIALNEDSIRSKIQLFLNALEQILYDKVFLKNNIKKSFNLNQVNFFEQIFKVRKFLRQPGSSTKSLIESVALSIPEL